MKLKNVEMSNYLSALNEIADKVNGMVAYGVARNIRKLENELAEYAKVKNDTIIKYGELGEDGISRIQINTPECQKFLDEMKQYDEIEHEVDLFMIKSSALQDSTLNAKEIVSIDFMLEE